MNKSTRVTGNETVVTRSSGDNEPAHYMLKVESFSLLSEAGIVKYESQVFDAAGHKWKLDLYPRGDDMENAGNHISLYLVICDVESLPKGWDVHVYFKFHVYDHLRHNYLIIQGADGKRCRFHEKKTKWGFPRLLSLDSFKETENGFLFQDSCVFGAEVFAVPKYAQKEDCLSMIKPPTFLNTYTWIIDKFSTLSDESLYSEDFKIGKVKWNLLLYPKGKTAGENNHLSLYLQVHDVASLPSDWRFYANYRLSIKNQTGSNNQDHVEETSNWFHKLARDWGFSAFMALSDLNDPEKGFVLDDKIIVEATILTVGIIRSIV